MRSGLTLLALASLLSGCTLGGAWNLGMIGVFAISAESERGDPYYHANPFIALDPTARRAVPPMDESRKVHEQDCSQPIEDWSANLRCR